MHVHRSNRAELLAAALAEELAVPLGDPFAREWIVVPGRGMGVWLSLELSRRLDIWSNFELWYPRRFVAELAGRVLSESTELVSRNRLMWAVLAELPQLTDRPEFERLARYIADDPMGLRRFQLAEQLAVVFDQYLTYRPDVILSWERAEDGDLEGGPNAWQPLLWRAVVSSAGRDHVARLQGQLLDALETAEPGSLPERVSVFGLSSLPPMYVRVLAALAKRIPVHIYAVSPSDQHWSELAHRREARRALDRTAGNTAPEDLHLELGHPLLGSLGALGAELQNVLAAELEALAVDEVQHDLHAAPSGMTMLRRLQADIFSLRAPSGPAPQPAEPKRRRGRKAVARNQLAFEFSSAVPPPPGPGRHRVAQGDESISIHSCHSPMREVEVLHDLLLDLLTREGSELQPRDVVVMMPDVDGYAPFVEAVFERSRTDEQFIPYRIADRSIRRDAPVIEGLQRILALATGRATASDVLDLLTLEAVARRFGIAADDLEPLTGWVVESGIRWGMDADHRARHGQPELHTNTWRFGLERLLLGYAMPGGGRQLFEGVLPYDEVEGHGALLLGRLAEVCERLFDALDALTEPRPVGAWRDAISDVLGSLLLDDFDTAWQHQRVREALDDIVASASDAGFDAAVHLDVLRRLLDAQIDDSQPARGFLAGGVTFCAMVPMRAIPFRVVCLLGMNDGAFPRSQRPVDFDLIARGPARLGDRSRRQDDRYLFLETLLSARERLVITYTGQSIRDNAQLPPSVLVTDLTDALVDGFEPPAEAAPHDASSREARLLEHLIVRHPLQGFSRKYFDEAEPRLFSYAPAYFDGAQSLKPDREPAPRLFETPLALDVPADRVQLSDLTAFFENPIDYLLRQRLGLFLRDELLDIPDREPIDLDPLQQYDVGAFLFALHLEGVSPERSRKILRASGRLPPGALGEFDHAMISRRVQGLVDTVQRFRGTGKQPAVPIDLSLPSGVRIVGELTDLWERAQLDQRYSRVSARHLVSMWIRHLALCAAEPAGVPLRSVVVGRPPENQPGNFCWNVFAAAKDPIPILERLVELYWLGQKAPLLFVPRCSLEFAREFNGRNEGWALFRANVEWNVVRSREPSLARALGSPGPPFTGVTTEGPPFEALALEVFGPMERTLETHVD